MQDVELITPTAGFVVKTKKKETGDKVFINVCHSSKITPATSKKAAGGSHWDVPYRCGALTPPRVARFTREDVSPLAAGDGG